MKKILILLGVLAVALTFGTAYAESSYMSAGEYNGITAFEGVPDASHDVGPGLALENGITAFDILPAVDVSEGAAAGGLRLEEPGMELWNGITVFDTRAIPDPN
ncbi:MAG TPA: hypothetical protein VEJ22_06410 [Nitrospirota bacterium]|nr:hypothetical protein [Nitrospirota bacterium]